MTTSTACQPVPVQLSGNPRAPDRCSRAGASPSVYFFLDFSNIAISARKLAPDHGDGLFGSQAVRLSSENLRLFVERDRHWGGGYAAAALANPRSPLKRQFEKQGFRFEAFERGEISGAEQSVDQAIQLEMYRLLALPPRNATVVLATGDGAGFDSGKGFTQALHDLYSHGFAIEVMSWRHSFNGVLRNWALAHGRAIDLDDFYLDLTFIAGGRKATQKHMLGKKLARSKALFSRAC